MKTVKIYTIRVEKDGDKTTIQRVNDGFNAYELLGVLESAAYSVKKQIEGEPVEGEIIKK